MKNFLSTLLEHSQTRSIKWLISSFMAGYLLATLLYAFFRPQVHHFLNLIF